MAYPSLPRNTARIQHVPADAIIAVIIELAKPEVYSTPGLEGPRSNRCHIGFIGSHIGSLLPEAEVILSNLRLRFAIKGAQRYAIIPGVSQPMAPAIIISAAP